MAYLPSTPARPAPAKPSAPVRPSAPAALVPPPTLKPSPETGIDNFLRLMRRELADPLAKIAELSDRMEELRASGFLPSTLSGQQIFTELADTAHRSAQLAGRLIQLGNVLTGASILSDERLLLADLLRTVAGNLADTARRRRVGIQLDDGRVSLAPVYGSTYWLGVALRQLMSLLTEVAPSGTHILLRLKQIGFHQLVSGHVNHGKTPPNTLDLLPPAARVSVKADLASITHPNLIDLALARAIIEVHGGTLKTDVTEGGALNEFHLTLPTGESQAMRERPECGNCPHMQQAEQFAHDIGELLNALNAESTQPNGSST